MSMKWKKLIIVSLMAMGIAWMPAFSRADEGYHPTDDGGSFGVGLELGDPGSWGITGKFWVDQVNAFQPAVKFNTGGPAILQLDYLWHNFDIIHLTNGGLPFYIGVGGNLALTTNVQFAGRLPIGVSYIFDKRNVPVDIYFQVVPTLWFYNAGATFFFYPELGAHFYL